MASAIQFIQFVSFSQRIPDNSARSQLSGFSAFWHSILRHPYISVAVFFAIAAIVAAVCVLLSDPSWGERYEFGPNEKDEREQKS
jgi:hypothetical protein